MADERRDLVPLESFIADITASNYFKDNPHLVDEASIARWIFLKLKNFGRNVQDLYEEVIRVDNYRGAVPENFSSLRLGVYCDIDKILVPEDADLLRVQSRLVGEKITCTEQTLCTDCVPLCSEANCNDRIVENYYLEGTNVRIYYKNPTYVRLGTDLIRNQCAADCVNRSVKDSPISMNIKGTTVYANFKEGNIYIQYYGLPMDENCLPMIPTTPNGWLEEYLEVYVKRRILEDAMLSGDSKDKQYLYNSLMAQEQDLQSKARSDTSKINMEALYKALRVNRSRMRKYDIYLGAIKSNFREFGTLSGFGTAVNPNPSNF